MPALVARVVALGFDRSAACCGPVLPVAAVAVVAAGQLLAGELVPVVYFDLVVRVFAVVVAAPASPPVARPVAVVDFGPAALAVVVVVVVVVAGQLVAGDFVPAVVLLVVVPGFGLAVYFDLVGRAVLAACFVPVVVARTVDPAAFALYFCLAGLVAERKSERRYRERTTKPLH